MKELIDKLPREIQDLIFLASDIARGKGLPVYLVGGFVRDLILGVRNLDLDIVVEGDGIGFAEELAGSLKSKLIRHPRFKTATIIYKSELKIDVASARKESYPQPAHLPVVEPSSLKDDHFRRDFTINAMAISITAENFGKLIDFFGGVKDIRNRKIRILHNLSFIDDPTRILRAVRFEQRYGFNIEPETLKNLKAALHLNMLERLEPQRLRDELILMLKEENPLKEIKRLKELAGFNFINPRLSASKDIYALMRSIGSQVNWFKKKYSRRRSPDIWLIYLMGLLDSLSLDDIRAICKRFVFRKGEEKRIINYKKIKHKEILSLCRKKIKPSRIFAILEPLSYEAVLLIRAKYKNRCLRRHIEEFFEIYNDIRLCVSGDDLREFGLAPGPIYKRLFAKVLKAKLDGLVKTKEEELFLIKNYLPRKSFLTG